MNIVKNIRIHIEIETDVFRIFYEYNMKKLAKYLNNAYTESNCLGGDHEKNMFIFVL